MPILDGVTVATSDLVAARPDIERYFLHPDLTDFSDEINEAKLQLYRDIKNLERRKNPGKTETELATLLDTIEDTEEDEPLKNIIINRAIAHIFLQNNIADLSKLYTAKANAIPINYTIDTDEEVVTYKPVRFGR